MSVAFYLDYKISEFVRTLQQQLVRRFGWNADDISGTQLALDSSDDFPVSLFVRLGGLRAFERSADDQRGGAVRPS